MATEPPSPDADVASAEQCMACRGTGQVISHLGGGSSSVTCPWCRGGGVRLAEVDAQAGWLDGREGEHVEPQATAPDPGEPGSPGGDAA